MDDNLKSHLKVFDDSRLDLGGQDDIAMYLGAYDDPEAEALLIRVCTANSYDEMVIDSAAESLAEIWERQKKFDEDTFERLLPVAKRYVLAYAGQFRKSL